MTPYVLSNCDGIIEMGVGGGNDGGNIIAAGTPKRVKTKLKLYNRTVFEMES